MSNEFSNDFGGRFHVLVRDADLVLLADPASLRQIGTRRRARTRVLASLASVLGVLAITVTVVAFVQRDGQPPTGGSPSTSPGVTITGQPTPTTSPAKPAECVLSDLDPRPVYGGGAAAGTGYQDVLVQNTGGRSCWFRGFPVLTGRDGTSGAPETIAYVHDGESSEFELPVGSFAQFTVATVNGNPYPSGAPECTHPVDYHDISVAVGGTGQYPLPAFGIRKECGEIRITSWTLSKYPAEDIPNAHRAS
jgi:hypothetical protein